MQILGLYGCHPGAPLWPSSCMCYESLLAQDCFKSHSLFLEHEERPSKGATYMVWDHEADSDGWDGGRGALLAPIFCPRGRWGKV